MDWVTRLERKYGRYAIKGFIKILVIVSALVFAVTYFNFTSILLEYMKLNRGALLKGQIWRLVTFIFVPESREILFVFLQLYLIYVFGVELERIWGDFRLNLYYLTGMLFTIAAAMITGSGTALYLNLSIFLAFAFIYPDHKILLFFIIPVKVKYLAIFEVVLIFISIIMSPLGYGVAAILSLGNFMVFFGKEFYSDVLVPRVNRLRKKYLKPKPKAEKIKISTKAKFINRCRECGRTSETNPELKFGYCIMCGSDFQYCQDHLSNHKH